MTQKKCLNGDKDPHNVNILYHINIWCVFTTQLNSSAQPVTLSVYGEDFFHGSKNIKHHIYILISRTFEHARKSCWGLAAHEHLRADSDCTIFLHDCSMWLAHVMSTTGIVSSKSDVQHLHDSCTQHEKCCRILKHVLKPYDSCRHNQNVRMTSCRRSLFDVSRACYKSHLRQS